MTDLIEAMNIRELEKDSKFMYELENLRHIFLTKNIKQKQFIEKIKFNESIYLLKVEKLIKEYIQRYDADKTGIPDFALESSGKF